MTPAELAELMAQVYNVSGDTREKAIRFFLAAAEYLGVPLSALLTRDSGTKPGNGSSALKRRRSTPRTAPRERSTPEDRKPAPPSDGESLEIELKSGGTLTLSASTKFFDLEPEDRNFVFGLLDKLRG